MILLAASWQRGRILPGQYKGEVIQEFFCLGCGRVCRIEALVRDTAPEECVHPDILNSHRETREQVNELFSRKL